MADILLIGNGQCGLAEALQRLPAERFAAAALSLPMENYNSEEVLLSLLRAVPNLEVIIYYPAASVAEAVRLLQLGAADLLTTPSAFEERIAHRAASIPLAPESWRSLLIGRSAPMQSVFDCIRLLGARRSTVLIQGETGTGKEMVARAIHQASARANLPMVSVNCTALPESLLEAELFGHVRGAFTGAVAQRTGRFEQAHRSTLFLDEIGDMPLETQAKLLRVLQERELQRLGSSDIVRVDVRFIAASNVDLEDAVGRGKFREDLFYRLNVVPIAVPPLRDRPGDIPALVEHFIEKLCRAEDLPLKLLSLPAMQLLTEYPWPGNVRQLENAVERAITLSGDRERLHPGDFPLSRTDAVKQLQASAPDAVAISEDGMNLQETVNRLEQTLISEALRRSRGNKTAAADLLGLKRTTLTAKLKTFEALAG